MFVVSFHGDREAPLQHGQLGDVARTCVVEERPDGGKARIACANRVAPVLFKMIEKREQQRRIEIPQQEVYRGLFECFCAYARSKRKVSRYASIVRGDAPFWHVRLCRKKSCTSAGNVGAADAVVTVHRPDVRTPRSDGR